VESVQLWAYVRRRRNRFGLVECLGAMRFWSWVGCQHTEISTHAWYIRSSTLTATKAYPRGWLYNGAIFEAKIFVDVGVNTNYWNGYIT